MESVASQGALGTFRSPKQTIGTIDADTAAKLITSAADIAVVLDREGVIQDIAFRKPEMQETGLKNWYGQPWIDTVTIESRPKIAELLAEVGWNNIPRSRQVNHPGTAGRDVPIRYSAIKLAAEGHVLAFGHDLRELASLQQRLVEAQLAMEREYARLRHAEARYRLLFQISSEPVIIVDASTMTVLDLNPAASQLVGDTAKRLIGRAFTDLFGAGDRDAVTEALVATRSTSRSEEMTVELTAAARKVTLSASIFRQDNSMQFLVRLAPLLADEAAQQGARSESRLLKLVQSLPDGFVVTDRRGRIVVVNAAFLDMAQLASEDEARGEGLDRWLGRASVEVNVLISNLREHGAVRSLPTVIRDDHGSSEEVEVSATSVPDGNNGWLGFMIRRIGRSRSPLSLGEDHLPRSVEQMTQLVGRVSLKDLVRETTDMIERLCIEAALEITKDNRASAAEMLGLSRQSLYMKLHRHGLGDLNPDNGSS